MSNMSFKPPVREPRWQSVEPARPPSVDALRACMQALHESFVQDEGIDDLLDEVLGLESALLTAEALDELLPRLCRHVFQLVNIAVQRVTGCPSPESVEVTVRAWQLGVEIPPAAFEERRGHARRLGLAAQDLRELLTGGTIAAPDRRWVR